jgi:hypothetical protein
MFLTTLSLDMAKMKWMMTHNNPTIPEALLFSGWSRNLGVVNDLSDYRHTRTYVHKYVHNTSTRDVIQAVVTYCTYTASVATAGRIICNTANTNTTQQRCRSFLLDIIKSYTSSYYRVFVPASRSQWPRGLRRESAAARLLGMWVRIQSAAWRSVCCECCVLLGRGLCVGLITYTVDLYRVWCVCVWS